jgi:hypothetical protein
MIRRTENHSMGIKHLPASASGDDINAALSEDGACVVDQVATPEVMDQVARSCDPSPMPPRSARIVSAVGAPNAPADLSRDRKHAATS